MGTHSVDSGTQKASSAAAEQVSGQQAANAAAQQQQSQQAFKGLFGAQGANGNYAGGSVSQFLDPSTLNQHGLNSTYQNTYNTEANQNAQAAQEGVATSQQNLASRGLGAAPAGFEADQQRKAYMDQAGNNAQNYSGLGMQQLQDAHNNYWQANNLLNAYGTNQGQLATSNNSGAVGANTSLYGTSSQQVQSPWGAALSGAAGLGAAAITKYCWVAAEIYGGWYEPRTVAVREWLFGDFARTWFGRIVTEAYIKYGERLAAKIRKSRALRFVFTRIANFALYQARKGR